MEIIVSVGIIVTDGKVFIPTHARTSVGFLQIDPVFVTEAKEASLEQAISQAKDNGNPVLSDEQLAEVRGQKSAILRATKKSSQKKLTKSGVWYNVTWTDKHISLYMSKLDDKGRWIGDRDKQRKLPLDTDITEIAKMIIQDANSRREVW